MKIFNKIKNINLNKPLNFGIYRIIQPSDSFVPSQSNDLNLIPKDILKPEYAQNNFDFSKMKLSSEINIKSKNCLEKIKESCLIAKEALILASQLCQPGISTLMIDKKVREFIISKKAYPSPLNYYGFPKSICTSINNVICHGIPNNAILMNGDIINCDITVYKNGFHGDTSSTFLIGNVDEKGKKLTEACKEALEIGIRVCRPGALISDIGKEIELFAQKNNYSICNEFTGHGIGSYFHEPPLIQHIKNNDHIEMVPGMIFTIEPMLCQGSSKTLQWPDDWTVSTIDGGRSSQFEHTILITETGYEILT